MTPAVTCDVSSIVLYFQHVTSRLDGAHFQSERSVEVVDQLTVGGLRRTFTACSQRAYRHITHARAVVM